MQNDREAGQTAGDFFQNVEAQGRRNEDALFVAGALLGLELISAVAGADGDGQGVTAGLGDELFDLFRTGVGGSMRRDLDVVLDAGESAQLGLDDDTMVMRVLDDLAGDLDVLFEGLGGGIDHDGGKAAVNAGLARLKIGTMIQMQRDGDVRAADDGRLDQLDQIVVVRVSTRALGNLKDDRSLFFLTGLGDALHDLHVVDVESADGVAAVVSLLEHFGSSYQSHVVSLLYVLS